MKDKLIALFDNTDSYVTPKGDFVVIDNVDIKKILELANEKYPNENGGKPWTLDDISCRIVGHPHWRASDEILVCDYCLDVIDLSSYYWTPEYLITECGNVYCGDCVEKGGAQAMVHKAHR